MTSGSISPALVADKIAVVWRMLDGIRSLPLEDLEAFTADHRMVAAGDSYLRRALEALFDLARHVLVEGFGRAPTDGMAVARQLGEVGVLGAEGTERLTLLAQYRDRLARYDQLSDLELFEVLSSEPGDAKAIQAEIREWLAAHPDRVAPTS